ncbi:MAG: phosphoribosylamine--glycine ligase [Candidatus Peribacteraceae bacterium]|jgi:phosphoribosylamine--glycine ligase|nr:phosphoribosylamine--glycine ligase [Candidatus Peribacteraceae bacterium]|tara:strand:+ start:9682 stop:11043 length:1362 start_codon:yes stop_codon:yes gene_type:complete
MKVLLISSSARGHSIADALARSPQKPEIVSICPSTNPGIKKLSIEQHVMDIMDFEGILKIASDTKPDFAIIGPEDPIGGGLADELEKIGIRSIAPKKSLSRIESSKGFTRNLLNKYGIDASPKFKVFGSTEASSLSTFIAQDLGGEFVVKYDALKGGKGVKVSGEHLNSVEEGVAYAKECIEECGSVVVEEKLVGPEFSLISFTSGLQVVDTPAIQDHKRAYEGDTGPNTGGMGTYSDADHSLPFLEASDIARASEINKLVADALMKECPEHPEGYVGFLYGGFILTKTGVKVIEYNCRLGDPEALNIMPLLESDFVSICLSMLDGSLSKDMVKFANKATVCKYITPESYPVSKDQKGERIILPPVPDNVVVFHGDLSEDQEGLLLGGSRTAGVVGLGATIEQAEHLAQAFCEQVTGPVRFRPDIGSDALIQQRVLQAKSIRTEDQHNTATVA